MALLDSSDSNSYPSPSNNSNNSHNSNSSGGGMTSIESSAHSNSNNDNNNHDFIEAEITSHLVVNSLILLGFNTDEYIAIYSGIAFDISPVTVRTFDKQNEKMFFIILHYLLAILDRDEFLLSIEKCWPFLDNKEKNLFKKALHISLIRLIEKGVVPNELYQGVGLLNTAMGREVWQLLHLLSDRAIDQQLREYREAQLPEFIASNDEEAALVMEQPTGGGIIVPGMTRDSLLIEIDEKIESVRQLILHCNSERTSWTTYLEELEHRLSEAKKSIKMTEQKLRELHLQDEYNVLAEQGRVKRAKLISRITSQKELLLSFLGSPLLQDVERHLQEEVELQQKEKTKAQQQQANNNSSSMNSTTSSATDAAKAKLDLANAPTRRKMLSKEEMEAYKISMRDAISTLVQKIEEVCTLV